MALPDSHDYRVELGIPQHVVADKSTWHSRHLQLHYCTYDQEVIGTFGVVAERTGGHGCQQGTPTLSDVVIMTRATNS